MRNNYEELTHPVSQGFSQFSTFIWDFDARTLKTVTDTKLEDSTNSKDDQTAIQEELDYSSTED